LPCFGPRSIFHPCTSRLDQLLLPSRIS
jgi:hypothetical protein